MSEVDDLTSQFWTLQAEYDEMNHKVEKTKKHLEERIEGSMKWEDSTQDYTKETWDTVRLKRILEMLT